MSAPGRARGPQLGVALGPDGLWAVLLERSGGPSRQAGPWAHSLDEVSPAELQQAFELLKDEVPGEGSPILYVALLAPLVRARRIELPRLRVDEARRALTFSAAKYFMGARDPQVVGARLLRGGDRSSVSVFASAVSEGTLDAVYEAAEEAGCRIESVVAAHDAWAHAVSMRMPRAARDHSWILHCREDCVEGVQMQGTAAALLRKAPAPFDHAALSDWLRPAEERGHSELPPRVAVLGDADHRAPVIALLSEMGVQQIDPGGRGFDEPELLAAGYARGATGPELLPDSVRAGRTSRGRRLTLALSGVAAALLLFAGGVELWAAHRELGSIRGQRTELAEQVQAVVAERETLLGLTGRLGALSDLEETAPRWSAVMSGVAQSLPEDAYLVRFEAAQDSAVLEGVAENGAGVFEALQAAPGVVGVRSQAPIRRELVDGVRSIERFTVVVRLSPALGEARR